MIFYKYSLRTASFTRSVDHKQFFNFMNIFYHSFIRVLYYFERNILIKNLLN